MFQKMYLFNNDIGYTYRCSIRIDNNKKAKKFKTDMTSRKFVSSNNVALN